MPRRATVAGSGTGSGTNASPSARKSPCRVIFVPIPEDGQFYKGNHCWDCYLHIRLALPVP